MSEKTKNRIGYFVVGFFSLIYALIIWAFSLLTLKIVPVTITGVLVIGGLIFASYRTIDNAIMKGKRKKRVVAIMVYISLLSFLIATISGGVLTMLFEDADTTILFVVSVVIMLVICVLPYLDLYIKSKKLERPDILKEDVKSAINFFVAFITILYGVGNYFGNSEWISVFTFLSLYPFGISIIVLAILHYKETKQEDDGPLKRVS